MAKPRTIDPQLSFKVASTALGRMACAFMDPTGESHDHVECLRDDSSYAADLQLRLLAAVAGGDDDTILERLQDLRDALDAGD